MSGLHNHATVLGQRRCHRCNPTCSVPGCHERSMVFTDDWFCRPHAALLEGHAVGEDEPAAGGSIPSQEVRRRSSPGYLDDPRVEGF